jgi:hypothetical protein
MCHHASFSSFVEMGLTNFLTRLTLNHDLLTLHLLTSWDYSCDPLYLGMDTDLKRKVSLLFRIIKFIRRVIHVNSVMTQALTEFNEITKMGKYILDRSN